MNIGIVSKRYHENAMRQLFTEIAHLKGEIALYQAGEQRLKMQAQHWEHVAHNRNLQLQRYEEMMDQTMKPFVDKLTHLRVERKTWEKSPVYQCSVSFCTQMVELCFDHGNSDAEIEFLSESVSRQLRGCISNLLHARNCIRAEEINHSKHERKV